MIKPDPNTTHLKVTLYHKKVEFPIEDFTRLFKLALPPSLNEKQILTRKALIKQKYLCAKCETDYNIKGRLLEEVVSDLFALVPGLKIVGTDINSGIEEIDLQVSNDNSIGIWTEFDRMFFIECKNWSSRVGSNEIRNFEGKLRNFWLHAGIFIAINGFTGGNSESGAIGQNKLRFKQEGFKIILIGGNDLDEIFDSEDLSMRINEKWINLYQ